MDFETRDRYRSAVEEIARTNGVSEGDLARAAIQLAVEAAKGEPLDSRFGHVGYYLIGDGRGTLIDAVGGKETARQSRLNWISRRATAIYLSSVGILTAGQVAIVLGLGLMADGSSRSKL
jgi:cyclic beta-1,2-glucan synthetase